MFSCYFIAFSAFVALASSSVDVTGFYPQINGNLTWITWAHERAPPLNDDLAMMFSENITWKTDDKKHIIPVLNSNHNVTLDDLLSSVETGNMYYNVSLGQGKGIKLSFTDSATLNQSLTIIGHHAKNYSYPLVIAADIVNGTTSAPINSTMFFELLNHSKFNLTGKVILSVGWAVPECIKGYPDAAIKAMGTVLAKQKGFVYNFPVRACGVAGTNSTFTELLKNITSSSVTVYSIGNDTVDVKALRQFVLDVGVNRTFLDVPQDLRDKLRLDQHHADSGAIRTLSALGVIAWTAVFLRFAV